MHRWEFNNIVCVREVQVAGQRWDVVTTVMNIVFQDKEKFCDKLIN
jgi:hypothetical protein